MEQFLMVFHHFPLPTVAKPSAEVLAAVNQQWQNYIGGIASEGLFIGTQRLDQAGSNLLSDGSLVPVVNETKGLIVGTLTVKASSLEQAIELAKGFPILLMGGSVEIRPVLAFDL